MKKIWLYIAFMTGIIGSLQAQNPTKTHLVKKGETLYRIHRTYDVTVDALKNSNPTIQGSTIKAGDVLIIPTKTTVKKEEQSTAISSKKKSVEVKMNKPIVLGDKVDLSKVKATRPTATVNPLAGPQDVSDKVNEIIKPTTKTKKSQTIVNNLAVNLNKLAPVVHEVKKGETLFSIAQQYKQSLNSLQNWNSLTGNKYTIKPTQLLIVDWKAEEMEPTIAELSKIITEKKPVIRPTKARPKYTSNYEKIWWSQELDSTNMYKSVKRTGIAIRQDDNSDDKIGENLYVLHRTAPLRSIVKVTNPINNQSVYVMVLERLQDTVENENVLMKLTLSAAKKINLLDDSSIVESHYHIQK